MRSVVGRVAVSLVVGVCVLGLASTEPHDRRVARWFGAGAQPALVFEVWVPPELAPEVVADLPWHWERRLEIRVLARPTPNGFTVEVVGVKEQDAERVRHALTASGILELRPIVADSEVARALFLGASQGTFPDVIGEVDAWRHDASGRELVDYYLRGPTVAAVEAAIAELQRRDPMAIPPPGQTIAYESIVPSPDAKDPRPYVRSYVVAGPPVIDGSDIAAAYLIFDPQTYRPEVLVELDEDGSRSFGEYTERSTGEKLAILLDGVVQSAPVIQQSIRGGRVNISMGGGSPEEQESEAEALIAVLGHQAALPPGLVATLISIEEPSLVVRWGVRLAVALAAGLLAFGLATLVGRRTVLAPVVPPSTTARPGAVVVPAAITIGLLALTVLLERVPQPWLAEWVDEMVQGDSASLSIVSLGITPVLTAYFLIELIALLVPSWRRRRLGTPVDRIPLDRAVAWLAAGLALVQGWFLAGYLQQMVLDRPALVDSLLVRVTVTVTLAGGVMLMAVFAGAISRAGLINGWLALWALGAARMFLDVVTAPAPRGALDPAPLQLITAVLAAAIAVPLVARRAAAPDRRRLPLGGIAPLIVAPTLVGVLAIPYLTTLPGLVDASKWLATRSPWLDLLAATVIAALWTMRRRPAVPSQFAMSASVATIALLAALPFLLPADHQLWSYVVSGALIAVALVELAAGVARRIRMPDGAALIAVHDVERADAVLDALHAAGIPAAPSGLLARALLRFFGPYLPVVVFVPSGRLDDATRLVQAIR